MEQRKIIKFGNSSYVITLPNEWIKTNKLQKGDNICLKELDNNLMVSLEKEKPEKTIDIKIDNMPLKIFNKKLISYYLKNYKFIKLTGNKVIERLEEIRIFKEKLSSIEIYEIGVDFILLKDLSNPEKLSTTNLISKMVNILDILYNEIAQECRHTFIGQIDSNINKLSFLAFKTINFNLETQHNIEETKNAIYYWRIVTTLETIGDILKRISRYLNTVSPQEQHYLKILLKNVKEYANFITGLLNKNINIDNNLRLYLDKKQSLLKELEEQKEKFQNNMNLYLVITQLMKDIIGNLDTLTLSIIDIYSK